MSQQGLPLQTVAGPARAVSPLLDLGAYEVLWSRPGASFKTVAEIFRENPDALPSDLVPRPEAEEMGRKVLGLLRQGGVERFGVRIHRAGEYPAKLRDARDPVELLYFQGWWNYVESPSVAVVGARKASEEGIRRARKLVSQLVEDGWTIVSGLAAGIDTAAHTTALEAGGRTIAVIGTRSPRPTRARTASSSAASPRSSWSSARCPSTDTVSRTGGSTATSSPPAT